MARADLKDNTLVPVVIYTKTGDFVKYRVEAGTAIKVLSLWERGECYWMDHSEGTLCLNPVNISIIDIRGTQN